MSEPIGFIHVLYGQATADGADGARTLSQGDPVFVEDTISTGPEGSLEIRFIDETILAQGPKSLVSLDEYVYDPDTGMGELLFELTEGTFRTVTGTIVDNNPDGFHLKSPLSNIGIRGTETGHFIPGPGAGGSVENHVILVYDGKPVVIEPVGGGEFRLLTASGEKVDVSSLDMSKVQVMTRAEYEFFQQYAPDRLGQQPPQFNTPDDIAQGDPAMGQPVDMQGREQGGNEEGGNEEEGGNGENGEGTGEENGAQENGAEQNQGQENQAQGEEGEEGEEGGPEKNGPPGEEGGEGQKGPEIFGQGAGPEGLMGSGGADNLEIAVDMVNKLVKVTILTGESFELAATQAAQQILEAILNQGFEEGGTDDDPINYQYDPADPLGPFYSLSYVDFSNSYVLAPPPPEEGGNWSNQQGSQSDDTLTGTSDPDQLFGYKGNDTMYGYGDEDRLVGGAGNDTMYGDWNGAAAGTEGNDQFLPGPGNDAIFGGGEVSGSSGAWGDTVVYVEMNAVGLHADLANNQVTYGFDGVTYTDSLNSIENVMGSNNADTIDGDAGTNHLQGEAGNDTIAGKNGADYLEGGEGDDSLAGDSGTDKLRGNAGNDTLFGGLDADDMEGGEGNDIFRFVSGDVVSGEQIDGGSGTDILSVEASQNFSLATLSSVETLTYATGGVTATFSSEQIGSFTQVNGSAGVDNFTINLSLTCRDVDLSGLAFSSWTDGTDIREYVGTTSDDRIDVGSNLSGSDDITAGGGMDKLLYTDNGNGNDEMTGVTGFEEVALGDADTVITVGNAFNASTMKIDATGLSAARTFEFSYTGEVSNPYTITGHDGVDTVSAGGGDDTIDLGAGNDTVYMGSNLNSMDTVKGGAGTGDQLNFTDTTPSVGTDLDNVSGFETITLGNADTKIVALDSLAEGNTVTVNGSGLTFSMEFDASVEDDTAYSITGGTMGDTLLTGSADDVLNGGLGDDILYGGGGNDDLTGGAGNDQFRYSAIGDCGDNVLDFDNTADADKFKFNLSVFKSSGTFTFVTGSFGSGYTGTGAALSSVEDSFVYDTDNDQLWYDANGDDSGGQTLVANVTGDDVAAGDIDFFS